MKDGHERHYAERRNFYMNSEAGYSRKCVLWFEIEVLRYLRATLVHPIGSSTFLAMEYFMRRINGLLTVAGRC
jgi:hypothetical protein